MEIGRTSFVEATLTVWAAVMAMQAILVAERRR
jgi:hypothetical protein